MPAVRRRCDLVFVFAVANGEWMGVEDLLDSFATYLDCDYQVLAADDASDDGTYEKLLDRGVWVVRNPERLLLWGVDLTLRRAFSEAVKLFDCPLYVKIDPDALVIGPGLGEALEAGFHDAPRAGLLGAYHIDWHGGPRDLSYWRERMLRMRHTLGKPFDLAVRNGYQPGDGVQGGAYALSRPCLETIAARGWLAGADDYRPSKVRGEHVAEDSLIAMLTYAAGFQVAEFGGPGQPLGIWDVGLPMPPEDLMRQGRLVTHSMKYADADSLAARAFFRAHREKYRRENARP